MYMHLAFFNHLHLWSFDAVLSTTVEPPMTDADQFKLSSLDVL